MLGPRGALTKAEAEARAARRPGARAVRAERGGWFALGGDPALTNTDVDRVRAAVDQTMQEPIVAIDLTTAGKGAFASLTRSIAHRGSARAAGAAGAVDALQHLAIVIDDQIVSVPFIDPRQAPDGIDGSEGVQIQGGLTPETAQRTAALLSAGPRAADLTLESAETTEG